MGRSQRDKGRRGEHEWAELIGGQRVPLSGAIPGYPGDVVGLGLTWECKRRAAGFKQLYDWLNGAGKDALAVRADRQPWLVVLPVETFLRLVAQRQSDSHRYIEERAVKEPEEEAQQS